MARGQRCETSMLRLLSCIHQFFPACACSFEVTAALPGKTSMSCFTLQKDARRVWAPARPLQCRGVTKQKVADVPEFVAQRSASWISVSTCDCLGLQVQHLVTPRGTRCVFISNYLHGAMDLFGSAEEAALAPRQ